MYSTLSAELKQFLVMYAANCFQLCATCMQHPAADIAAQVASALAMSAKVSMEHNSGDYGAADRWLKLAEHAYTYAKQMENRHGDNSTCSKSEAVANCLGNGCTTVDLNGMPVKGVRICITVIHVAF